MPDQRYEGFRSADIAVDMLRDPKMARLYRAVGEAEYAACVVVYLGTVLTSWADGERVTAREAEAFVDATPERVGALQAVSLLDGEGKVPARAWDRWNAPARERVEAKRRAGKTAADARWGKVRADAAAMRTDAVASEAMRGDTPHHATPRHASGAANAAHTAREEVTDDEDAHLQAWYQVMASPPSPRVMPWLDDLAQQFGAQQVAHAIGTEAATDSTRNTLLGRVQARLTIEERHADRESGRARERARKEAEREERERIEAMPLEQRQANLARLREAMQVVGTEPGKRHMNGREGTPRTSRATRTEHR